MKRIIVTAIALFVFLGDAFAEDSQLEKNTILIKNQYVMPSSLIGDWFDHFLHWDNFVEIGYYPAIGYIHSKAYPIGINVGGLRLGFTTDKIRYAISEEEYRVPTWSIHAMGMKGISLAGPFGASLGIDLGLNMAKRYTADQSDPTVFNSKNKPYISVAPLVGINIFNLNAYVGYEFIPSFKDIQGWIFGAGLSWCIFDE